MLIHLVAAARPNFMKIAPLYHALKKEDWATPVIVHTGQHYDLNMSDVFFRDLGLPDPHVYLGVGSGSHAEQTGRVMMAYEKVLSKDRPDLVVVVGDVNSTMACTIAASKMMPYGNPINTSKLDRPVVAHLEAGLRSFDRTMPEEINRLVTDTLADILWTPSPDADENLLKEGIDRNKIVRVGNIMIDSFEMLRSRIVEQAALRDGGLAPGTYGIVTIHRPSNVDTLEALESLCRTLTGISKKIRLLFPVHPRTRKNLEENGLISSLKDLDNLQLLDPTNYIQFMGLILNCRFVITDSGGIQEETSYLGIPCLTMRPNTERPITILQGTNQLCTHENIEEKVDAILSVKGDQAPPIELWDGNTAARIVRSIKDIRIVISKRVDLNEGFQGSRVPGFQ